MQQSLACFAAFLDNLVALFVVSPSITQSSDYVHRNKLALLHHS